MKDKLNLVIDSVLRIPEKRQAEIKVGVAALNILGFGEYAYCGNIGDKIFYSNEPFQGASVVPVSWEYGYLTIPKKIVEASGMQAGDVSLMYDPKNNDLFIVPKSA